MHRENCPRRKKSDNGGNNTLEKPKEGEYVSYKEFLYLVIGNGTSMVASWTGSNLSFSAGCMFVGAIYGLKMLDFAMLGIVNLVMNYLFSPINMIITDNLGTPPKKTMRLINWASLAFLVLGIGCFFIPQEYFEGFMPALPQVVGSKFLIQVFSTYYNIIVLKNFLPNSENTAAGLSPICFRTYCPFCCSPGSHITPLNITTNSGLCTYSSLSGTASFPALIKLQTCRTLFLPTLRKELK